MTLNIIDEELKPVFDDKITFVKTLINALIINSVKLKNSLQTNYNFKIKLQDINNQMMKMLE